MPSTDDVHALKPLRILIANERQDRLLHVAQLLQGLGHEVIAPQIEVEEVALSPNSNSRMSPSSGSARAPSMLWS
jgi:hypothetical protein